MCASIELSVRAERDDDDTTPEEEDEEGTREAGRETVLGWAGFETALNEEVL